MMLKLQHYSLAGAIAAATVLLPTGDANAALLVNVSDLGGGQTQWDFSGSTTTSSADTFGLIARNNPFNNLANSPYTIINDQDINAVSGSASITVGANTSTISQLYLDFDGTNEDEFGVAGDSTFNYSAGEAVSWVGSLVMPIAISDLIPGTYGPATSSTLGSDITLNIGQPVPEPLTMLGASAAVAFGAAFKRKQKG